MRLVQTLNRLNARIGAWWCLEREQHDHPSEYAPTATEMLRFKFGPAEKVNPEPKCLECGAPFIVESDGGELLVMCENEHEVYSADLPMWRSAVAAAGYTQVCLNWWEGGYEKREGVTP